MLHALVHVYEQSVDQCSLVPGLPWLLFLGSNAGGGGVVKDGRGLGSRRWRSGERWEGPGVIRVILG